MNAVERLHRLQELFIKYEKLQNDVILTESILFNLKSLRNEILKEIFSLSGQGPYIWKEDLIIILKNKLNTYWTKSVLKFKDHYSTVIHIE